MYDGIAAWQGAGYHIDQLWQISTEKLKNKLENKSYDHFTDVRTPAEWSMGHIEGAIHLPLTTLLHDLLNFAKDEEVNCHLRHRLPG